MLAGRGDMLVRWFKGPRIGERRDDAGRTAVRRQVDCIGLPVLGRVGRLGHGCVFFVHIKLKIPMHLWTDKDEEEENIAYHAYYRQLRYTDVLTERETELLGRKNEIEQKHRQSSSFHMLLIFPCFDSHTVSVWEQYRSAGLKPSARMLNYLHQTHRIQFVQPSTTSAWAKLWKMALECSWIPRDACEWPTRIEFFEHWFADQQFWQFLLAEINISMKIAAEIRHTFQKILYYLQHRNRPDIVCWFMTLKDKRGCQVIKRKRATFKFFFERLQQPPWYDWYQQHVALPQKLTVLGGTFKSGNSSSPLYRAFSRHPLAERQLLRLVLKMAFE